MSLLKRNNIWKRIYIYIYIYLPNELGTWTDTLNDRISKYIWESDYISKVFKKDKINVRVDSIKWNIGGESFFLMRIREKLTTLRDYVEGATPTPTPTLSNTSRSY